MEPHIVANLCPVFPWISLTDWNLFPFKGDFNFGKSQKSLRAKPRLKEGLSHLDYLMFCQNLCMSYSLLNHPNSFYRGMFKLNSKFDADSLLCLPKCFECYNHTVHMLTQQRLQPPMTSEVKSSLFTYMHSSPFFLSVKLHWCHTNCSHYINNGWTFSGQTS